MKIKTLSDVLKHEIEDLYSAETQITRALPKMAETATTQSLKEGFKKHLEETKDQIQRLEKAAKILKVKLPGTKCKGMEGLLKEGAEILEMKGNTAIDALLISAAQRVEHYEIAGYGCAFTYAQTLHQDEVANLLEATLTEEEATDEKLTEIAENEINEEAAEK